MKLNTTFHPQTDGQAGCTIQTLEDLLMACTIDFKGNWDKHLPLVEFSYNNSFKSSISTTLNESSYGRRCMSPIELFELDEPTLICPDLVYKTFEKVHIIRNQLQTTYNL